MKTKILILLGIFCLVLVIGFLCKDFINNFDPKITNGTQTVLTAPTTNNLGTIKQENQYLSRFYSRGSYTTAEPLVYEEYKIGIFIETVENTYEDFDNPKFIEPKVYIRLVDSKRVYSDYVCLNPTMSKEKIYFKFTETPIGVISIDGKFVDNKGQLWAKMHAENYKTILRGKLTIEQGEEIKYSKIHDFVYWDGTGD